MIVLSLVIPALCIELNPKEGTPGTFSSRLTVPLNKTKFLAKFLPKNLPVPVNSLLFSIDKSTDEAALIQGVLLFCQAKTSEVVALPPPGSCFKPKSCCLNFI